MRAAMFNWRRPRTLGIMVGLGMIIAAGGAAVVSVALTGGGWAGVNYPKAQSVAQLGAPTTAADDSGAGVTNADGCPPTDRPRPVSHRPGSDQQLVPAGERTLIVCRYQGLNPPRGGAEFQLIGAGETRTLATVRSLAGELNALKPIHSSTNFNCPDDDGSELVAYFRYSGGVDDPVVVGLSGCQEITNGPVSRMGLETAPVIGKLTALAADVHTQVATFNGRVRVCGGKAPGRCRTSDYSVCRKRCHRTDHVEAVLNGVSIAAGRLHKGRFHFDVPVAGRYKLKLMTVRGTAQATHATARLGHATDVTFTHPVK